MEFSQMGYAEPHPLFYKIRKNTGINESEKLSKNKKRKSIDHALPQVIGTARCVDHGCQGRPVHPFNTLRRFFTLYSVEIRFIPFCPSLLCSQRSAIRTYKPPTPSPYGLWLWRTYPQHLRLSIPAFRPSPYYPIPNRIGR